MEIQQIMDMIRGKNSSSAEAESRHVNEDPKSEESTDKKYHEKLNDKKELSSKAQKNPYSQEDLEKFITGVGFKIDETPKFTEMSKKLGTYKSQEPTTTDLTKLDNHDTIQDISPLKKNEDREVQKQALKKLIAKYRG